MKINRKSKKNLHIIRRQAYQLKRRKAKWKDRKKKGVKIIAKKYISQARLNRYPKSIDHKAPNDFRFLDNTNEIIDYFLTGKKYFDKGRSVLFNIEEVKQLSIDSITLLAAYSGDELYHNKKRFIGNAPNKKRLRDLFMNSGFYEYVISSGKKPIDPHSKLFRFTNKNTTNNDFAAEVSDMATEFAYNKDKAKFAHKEIDLRDEIYNLIIEAMSNTNHHASAKRGGKKWWLYVQKNEEKDIFSICLVDLGIGIFESANFRTYRKLLSAIYQGNLFLVDDFLNQKMISSLNDSDETRGKGVRQMIRCAQKNEIKCLWVITNDVKFEIKSKTKFQLTSDFNGTCLYLEIQRAR